MKTPEGRTNYFDIVINVKETSSGKYVYTIQVNESKKRKGQPLANTATVSGPVYRSQEAVPSYNNIPQNGENVNRVKQIKLKQLEIIKATNPAPDGYHTWIRSADDIKTAEEVFTKDSDDYFYPDFTQEDAQRALDTGKVTVYSSKKIENGVFVSPSVMNAKDYAGGQNKQVYSKSVNIDDVAWIDSSEGQFAKISDSGESFSLKEESDEVKEMRDLLVKARFDSKTIIRTEDIKPAVRKFLREYHISENEIS